MFAPGAQAANIEVNSLDDPGDGTCDATECTLREAVDEANGNGEADVITFASGLSGTIDLFSGPGEIEITDAVQIQGPGANVITIDADEESRIFYVAGDQNDAIGISGLSFTGGYSEDPGGAVYHTSSDLTISNAVFRENVSEIAGGAIASGYATGLEVVDSTVRRNVAGGAGGGIAAYYSDALITGSVIVSNTAGGKYTNGCGCSVGGGVATDGASLEIGDSRVANNFAKYGGGVYSGDDFGDQGTIAGGRANGESPVTIGGSEVTRNLAKYAGGGIALPDASDPVTITNTEVTRNDVLGEGGGGIQVGGSDPGGTIEIADSTIADNSAGLAGMGGGIHLYETEDATTITRTTISGNTAGIAGGGAAVSWPGQGGAVTFTHSTLSDNEAEEFGGGAAVVGDAPVRFVDSTVSGNTSWTVGGGLGITSYGSGDDGVEVDNSTVANNSAAGNIEEGAGGGIFAADAPGDVTISSSIASGNDGGDLGGHADDQPDGDLRIGFSLIEDPGATQFTADPAGSNLTGANPLLGPLADNGGPTQTHLPADDSPVIDAGIANGLLTDQRGDPRTVERPKPNAPGSDGTDMGSVELGPVPETYNCQGNEVVPIEGTDDEEALVGTNDPDAIFALGSNDRLEGLVGPDCLFGGPGNDILQGQAGKDLMAGEEGRDRLVGDGGRDRMDGGDGNDKLRGDEARDRLSGGRGNDKLRGGLGRDHHKGGPGNDGIYSVDNKRDKVDCGPGNDRAVTDARDKVAKNCEKVITLPRN